jgi:DNA-binding PadR family transcriptional regulator
MRVSPNERVVLALLSSGGPAYGLQLVEASGGRLKRGGIYVTLGGMEDKGLVTSRPESDGRRIYQLTGLGHRAIAAAEILHGLPDV